MYSNSISYPIAELFVSVQGEGSWTGTPMNFIRFAGCSVGKPYRQCKSALGFEFYCDTEYKLTEKKSLDELVVWCQSANHVCLTGGEPFDHNIQPLVERLREMKIMVHIETSGTYSPYSTRCKHLAAWITVSPKENYYRAWHQRASELKWLVEAKHPVEKPELLLHNTINRTYIQPVWGKEYDENLKYALELCKTYNGLKLSLQMHKYIEVK